MGSGLGYGANVSPVQCSMIGCEEGLLPHARSREGTDDVEEERRLCFVGMTRARARLWMTHAANRTVRGMRMGAMESGFLREIPEEHVERTGVTRSWLEGGDDGSGGGGSGDDAVDAPWMDEFEPARPKGLGAQFPVGCQVRHALFGIGTVQAILPRGSVTSVRVAFRTVGVKTLVLEYAKLVRA